MTFNEEDDDVELLNKSEKFRILTEKMGPAYVKIGQILSMRYDLIPKSTCQELQILLDSGEALPFSVIEKKIKEELGKDESKILLAKMNKKAFAVASIGQVHVSYINKKKVAVKVLKPGTREIIKKDFRILEKLLSLLNVVPSLKKLRLKDMFGEFKTWTLRELDFRVEAINTQKFAEVVAESPNIYVPKVYNEFVSNDVLVTEFIEGASLKEILNAYSKTSKDKVKVKGITFSKKKLIEILPDIGYKQVFEYGFIHGDPHPSNVILINSQKVAFIDFGIVAKINKSQMRMLEETVYYLATGNIGASVTNLLLMDRLDGSEDKETIIKELKPMFEKYQSSTAVEYSSTEFLLNAIYKTGQLGIEAPLYLVIIAKVLASYDSVIQILDPKITIVEKTASYFNQHLTQNILEKFNTKKITFKALKSLDSIREVMETLPDEILTLVKNLQTEGIKVTTVSGDNNENEEKNKAATRILFLWGFSFVLIILWLTYKSNTQFLIQEMFFLISWAIISIILLFKLLSF